MQVVMFSKMLGGLSVEQAGDAIAEMGFDGVDLTVREGGHVLPENAAQDLPKAVDLLRSKRLSVPMITTGIVDPDEPHTEAILGSASFSVPNIKIAVAYIYSCIYIKVRNLSTIYPSECSIPVH